MSYFQEKPVQFWGIFIVAVIATLWIFSPILSPFIVGFAVAYLLNPLVAKLHKKGIPRWLSALLILLAFFMLTLVALISFVPLLVKEMIEFIAFVPVGFVSLQDWISNHFPQASIPQSMADLKALDTSVLSEKAGSLLHIGKNIMGNIFASGMAVLGVISFLALMPIVAFYVLIDWSKIGGAIEIVIPKKKAKRIRSILGDIDASLSGFIRGQLLVCFFLGLFYAVALSVMGLDYGFFIGAAAGLLSIVPYIGSLFGLVASVGMAMYQFGGWEYPLIALIIFGVGQVFEGNYLTPKLVGESVGLHPLWVIFALMAGGMLLGFLGMMIAIPVAAIIAVLIRHGIAIYKDSAYYKGKG